MQLYKKSLDYNKIIYLILKIKKHGFEKFDFVVSPYLVTFTILKIMIFFDNINIAGDFELYL